MDTTGASLPEYEEVCEVSAELNTLVSHLPAFGKSRSPKGVEIPGWVIIEVEVSSSYLLSFDGHLPHLNISIGCGISWTYVPRSVYMLDRRC